MRNTKYNLCTYTNINYYIPGMWTRQQQTKLAEQSTYIFFMHTHIRMHYIPGMWTRQQQTK
jgi:hypothetical protein